MNFNIGDKKSKLGVDKGPILYYYVFNLDEANSKGNVSKRGKGALRNQ